jgi:glycosyltransferase involved in cell wall biosynthesis
METCMPTAAQFPTGPTSTSKGARPDDLGYEVAGNQCDPTVSVIIPALNEARNLPNVLVKLPPVHEVILVDGGSVDDTVAVALRLRPDIRVVQQNRRGKGNALVCGFAAATGDIIVTVDADGSNDPAEIHLFVAALRGGADFAKGSRFTASGGSADITATRRFGNRVLSALVNVLFRTDFSDLCYGYNAFWVRCLPVFGVDSTTPVPPGRDGRLWGDGFEIETLLNLRAARAELNVVEVPSFEHVRVHGTSNLNAVTDGIRVLRTIAREWPRPARCARRDRQRGEPSASRSVVS